MKVRVVKTPSFAGGGLYDNGYELSPGEFAGVAKGYTDAIKNNIGAGFNFMSAASPTLGLALNNDKIQKTLGFETPATSTPGQAQSTSKSSGSGLGSLASTLGSAASTASTLSSLGSLLGGAGSATGAAAGAAGGAAGLAGLASSLGPLVAIASDKRVKENIQRVGETYDGQNIYRFNYKGDPHTQLGLIAQEVEKTGNADSVYNVNGIKMVDYNGATQDAAQKGKFMNGGNYRKKLSRTMMYAEAGGPTNPQLLQAYHTIANELASGADPNALVGQFVDTGMNYDDAQEIVSQVMDFMNPTSEETMPQAQMGGGMNAGMFAGQSMEPHIIDKPLMKDGGYTFITSQPAYTQKSYNYFGTSNAPARDSYTDNQPITTSVKAVPREDATIEAEKGEYIFSDTGLYKIQGKKHSQGGTPLAAKGGEFIFSDHKDMSIDPKLQKEANLKVSSAKSLMEHTPAKVLERNVDVKEFNRLKVIVNDPKSDPITKKTANFMLEKMQGKLDVIAKLQEANKQPNPVEIKDQYLEQPEVQDDINEQKQFAQGGFNLPTYEGGDYVMDPKRAAAISQAFGAFDSAPAYATTPQTNNTDFSNVLGTPGNPLTFGSLVSRGFNQQRAATSPYFDAGTPANTNPGTPVIGGGPSATTPTNTPPSEQDIFLQGTPETNRLKALQASGYTVAFSPRIGKGDTRVPSVQAKQDSGLYGDVQLSELGEFKNRHKWYFDKHPNWNASNPDDVKDFQSTYNTEFKKKYGYDYYSANRGFNKIDSMFGEYTYNSPGLDINGQPISGSTSTSGTTSTTGGTPSGRTYTGTEYDNVLQNPYDEVRARRASQYMMNVASNKPYFTYAAPVNTPFTEAGRMSSQPLLDEAAKARYSANQLASRFGDSTQRMMAAAQQNDAVNKGLFNIDRYNTEAEAQNRAQNLLRSSAAANTWNDRLKQTYDQNTNVLDKMNYANAAYYNQYANALNKDVLDQYYSDRDLQTAYLPYLSSYDVQNPDGTWTKRVAAPTYLNGRPNPNWNAWNTSAVASATSKDDNTSLTKTIQTLKDQGFNLDQISRMLGKQKISE